MSPSPDRYQQSTTARLSEVEQLAANHAAQLTVGSERMDRLEAALARNSEALAANTRLTQSVQQDTAEMVAWIKAIQGATRVLEAIGKLAKPLGYILLAVGVVAGWWASLKGHLPFGGKP